MQLQERGVKGDTHCIKENILPHEAMSTMRFQRNSNQMVGGGVCDIKFLWKISIESSLYFCKCNFLPSQLLKHMVKLKCFKQYVTSRTAEKVIDNKVQK